jgi:uroporphyrinogen decarboxylase
MNMPKESMTPKERWLAVLNRKQPDRVPTDYWGTGEINQKMMEHTGCASFRDMMKLLHIDNPVSVGPRYVGPPIAPHTDVFKVGYTDVDFGTGVYEEPRSCPLAPYNTVDEIQRNYTWPDPDWWDYREIPGQLKGLEEYPVRGGGSEPFLIYKNLRGQEQAMIDLVDHPDIVQYCLEKLFELAYQETLRIYEAIPGKVTITYIAEDLGGQRNLLFSPAQIRKFLFPGMKRMIDLAHQAGAYVFHHDDGNVTRILPDLVNLGIDALNPIQWRADGMDREMLKQQYGKRLTFHGAMDNQYTLPFGAVEEVRQEVRDNLHILGAGGGYILAPCHNLQPITPIENILAMYETAYEEGWT